MKEYFYLDIQNKQQGPVAAERLTEFGVKGTTLVWCKGMIDWAPAESIPELRELLEKAEQTSAQQADYAQPNAPHEEQQAGSQQKFQQTFHQNGQAQSFGNGQNPYGCYQNINNRPPYPNSHMVGAVLSTICCCLPLGIVAIVKASQVSGLYAQGLYDEAYLAAEDAKKWSIIALILGLVSLAGFSLPNLFRYY